MRAERLTDTVTLYEGDCLDVLPTLEPGSVDAVITDPPYGEKTHAGARGSRPGVSLTTEKLITFDSVDDAAFLSLCEACVRVSRRWVLAGRRVDGLSRTELLGVAYSDCTKGR